MLYVVAVLDEGYFMDGDTKIDADQRQLLEETLSFCRKRGISDTTWGKASPVNDSHLMARLRRGGLRRDTVNRVRRWMALEELST
jgi:hypothetical protein